MLGLLPTETLQRSTEDEYKEVQHRYDHFENRIGRPFATEIHMLDRCGGIYSEEDVLFTEAMKEL